MPFEIFISAKLAHAATSVMTSVNRVISWATVSLTKTEAQCNISPKPFDSCLTFSIAILSIAYSFNYTVFNRFMTHRNWHRYISNWVINEDLKLSEKRFGIILPAVFIVFVKFNTNWSFLIEFAKAWEIFPLIVLSFLLKK